MKYINTTRNATEATYVQLEPVVNGSELQIKVRPAKPLFKGQPVKVVNGSIRLAVPTTITLCGDECPGAITEAVTLSFNLLDGGVNLDTYVAEVTRVLGVAVQAYKLANGLVPPTDASFTDA